MYLLEILHDCWCRRLLIPLSSDFPASSTEVCMFMGWQKMRHACYMCTMPNPPTPSWSSLWHPLCQVLWLNIQHSCLSIHIRKLNSPTSPWEREVAPCTISSLFLSCFPCQPVNCEATAEKKMNSDLIFPPYN